MKALLVNFLQHILERLSVKSEDELRFEREDEERTLMVVSGEDVGLMELGLALPFLASMFPHHHICFDQHKQFSRRNGMGSDVLFVYDADTHESVVLRLEDLLTDGSDRVLH